MKLGISKSSIAAGRLDIPFRTDYTKPVLCSVICIHTSPAHLGLHSMPGTIATFQTEHLEEDRITQHTYLEFDSSHGTRAAARNLSRKYSIDFGCAARSDGLLKSARKYVHRRPSGPPWDHGPQEKRDLPSCLMAEKSAGIVPDSALHPDKRTLTDIPLSCLYSPSPPPPGLTGTNRTEPIGGILYVVGCDHPCSVLCCTYIHTYILFFLASERTDQPIKIIWVLTWAK